MSSRRVHRKVIYYDIVSSVMWSKKQKVLRAARKGFRIVFCFVPRMLRCQATKKRTMLLLPVYFERLMKESYHSQTKSQYYRLLLWQY